MSKNNANISAVPKTLADLSEYTKQSISWDDGTGESLNIYWKPEEKSQVIIVDSDSNLRTVERIKEVTFQTTGSEEGRTSSVLSITQEAATVTYADPVITGVTYEVIPASGGTVVPVVTYEQTWGYNGETTGGGVITEGATLSYSGSYNIVDKSTGAVTAESKGTSVSDQSVVDRVTVTVELNGKTSSSEAVTVYQEDNEVVDSEYSEAVLECTYVQVARAIRALSTTVEIPVAAAGGSYQPVLTGTQTRTDTYTSGDTRDFVISEVTNVVYSGAHNLVDASTGEVVVDSLETTIKEETEVELVTVSGVMSGETITCDTEFRFVQAENKIEKTVYYSPTVSVTYDDPVSADGGSATPTVEYQQVIEDVYSSGASAQTYVTTGADISYSDTLGYIDSETGVVTFPALDPGAASSEDVVTITVTVNGQTTSEEITVVQEANELKEVIYGDVYVSLIYGDEIIPAAGGSVTPTISYTQEVQYVFNSGDVLTEQVTTGGTVEVTGATYDDGTVSAESLGTTVKEMTEIASVSVKVTLNGKIGESDTITIYQEANDKTLTSYEYSDPVVVLTYSREQIPASGGSVTPTVTYSQTLSEFYTYTSGATEDISSVITSGAEISYTGTQGVVASDGTVSAESLGTTLKEETTIESVIAVVTMNGKTTSSNSVTITQEANEKTSSYSTPEVTLTYSPTMIPASGGTSTPTLSYSQVELETYTSGATVSNTITSGAEVTYSGQNGVVASDGTVTASSRGTVLSSSTLTVDIVTATVTLNGETGSSASVTILQEENVIVSTRYEVSDFTLTYNDGKSSEVNPVIEYPNGTAYLVADFTAKEYNVYTSGEEDDGTEVSLTPTYYEHQVNTDLVKDGLGMFLEIWTGKLTWAPTNSYDISGYPGKGDGETYELGTYFCQVVTAYGSSEAVFTSEDITVYIKESIFQVDPTSISDEGEGGDYEVTVTSNDDWTVE